MASKLRPTYAFKQRLEFLSSGKLYLKDSVKIITFSYKTNETASRGLRYCSGLECFVLDTNNEGLGDTTVLCLNAPLCSVISRPSVLCGQIMSFAGLMSLSM